MKEFKIGVTVLVFDGQKVLLGTRLKGSTAGTWGFPGGHVEVGEQLTVAAARELQEETGLVAESLEFLGIANYPDQDHHWLHVNFLVTKWHGEVENLEPDICSGWQWFSFDTLPEPIARFHGYIASMYEKKQQYMEV